MDPDMNKYDLEHVTTGHSVMTSADWQEVYRHAWDLYYSAEHIETIFRARQGLRRQAGASVEPHPPILFHLSAGECAPAAGPLLPAQIAAQRRAGLPRETPLVFYVSGPEVLETHVKLAAFYLDLHRIRRRVERDPRPYTDPALAPIDGAILPTRRKEKVLTGATA